MATVKVTPAMVEQAMRETDWAAVDAQTDADIARHVAEDPDATRSSLRPRRRQPSRAECASG